MIEKRTWEEFRETRLLQFANTLLHVFGWAIVLNMKDGVVTDVYPARVKFRGFDEKNNAEMYVKLSEYMAKNGEILLNEANE